MNIKRFVTLGLCTVLAVTTFASCGKTTAGQGTITVVSREEGSGTRSAFTELIGVLDENDNDITFSGAEITNSTSVMVQTIAGNENAIGYISLGALTDDVKAIEVDGVAATVENIKSGTYKVSRPFNIVTTSKASDLAKDFQKYILSKEGQTAIEGEGYISNGGAEAYSSANLTGKLTIAGSTSVAPVMEVLAENYEKLNKGVEIEIQQSGSSAGITAAIEGACDIGMASRELKDTEEAQGLVSTQIALDGIAIIVNKNNEVENLATEIIKGIYIGETTTWEEARK